MVEKVGNARRLMMEEESSVVWRGTDLERLKSPLEEPTNKSKPAGSAVSLFETTCTNEAHRLYGNLFLDYYAKLALLE